MTEWCTAPLVPVNVIAVVWAGGSELPPPHAVMPISISTLSIIRMNSDGIIRRRRARLSFRVPSKGRKIPSNSCFGNPKPPVGDFDEALVFAVLMVTVITVALLPAEIADGVIV